MKKFALLVLMSAGFMAAAADREVAGFADDVAVFRRVIRQYCAIMQQMMGEPELDKAKQEKGLAFLAQARPMWTAIQQAYGTKPPAEFAKDRAFKVRLQDIANAADDMTRALQAGDARRSMLACGFACGLFVRMHEENGINFALDKLFHLRHDIRVTASVMRLHGVAAIKDRLPVLLQKRDAVLLAPPPFPPEHEKAAAYTVAVAELSQALDRLARAVAAGDTEQAAEILADGVRLVNKPYGLAL